MFKTAAYFANEYGELDDQNKGYFQTQLLMMMDPFRVSDISVEDAFKNGVELYCMYSAYHLGKHQKAKEIISRIKYKSAICETLKYIYNEDKKAGKDTTIKRLRVSFIDFWGIDGIENSFILWSLKQRKNINIEITIPEKADVVIFLSYTYMNRLKRFENKFKVYWSSEQDIPERNTYDLSVSSINLIEDEDHVRYMPWLGCVRFPGLTDTFYGKGHIQVELKDLYEPSFGVHKEIRNKKYISSAIISNPVKTRVDFVNELEKVLGRGSILKGGRVFRNRIESKFDALKTCLSNICFENSIVPGYITEKLFEAKVVGCLPIYSGHKSVSMDFNTRGFINVELINQEGSIKDVDYIAKILKDDKVIKEMMAEPLFNKPPDIINIVTRINNKIKGSI